MNRIIKYIILALILSCYDKAEAQTTTLNFAYDNTGNRISATLLVMLVEDDDPIEAIVDQQNDQDKEEVSFIVPHPKHSESLIPSAASPSFQAQRVPHPKRSESLIPSLANPSSQKKSKNFTLLVIFSQLTTLIDCIKQHE